jgi:hypothetical protein
VHTHGDHSCTSMEASYGPDENIKNNTGHFKSTEKSENSAASAAELETLETEEQRLARELHESEQLAYAMMREEAEQAYTMQMEFMRENASNLSAEDLAALQAAVGVPVMSQEFMFDADSALQSGGVGIDTDEADTSSDSVNSNTSGASSAWSDPNNYERLLALGNQIGDVKTERWRLRAQSVIDALPHISYREILNLSQPAMHVSHSDTNSHVTLSKTGDSYKTDCAAKIAPESYQGDKVVDMQQKDPDLNPRKRLCLRTIDSTCSVCMDKFDEVENLQLILLPCSHYLHDYCIKAWMSDNNSCPICLKEVSPA